MADIPHDAAVAGVSESCKFNDHELCRSPRCGCDCHTKVRAAADIAGVERITAPMRQAPYIDKSMTKSCPICKGKFPADQNYCKQDGSRLSSLLCPNCSSTFELADKYCGECGCVVDKQMREDELVAAAARGDIPVPVVPMVPIATPVIPELAAAAADIEPKTRITIKPTGPAVGTPVKQPVISTRMFKT